MHIGWTDIIIALLFLLIVAVLLDSFVRFFARQVRGFVAEFKRGYRGYPNDQQH